MRWITGFLKWIDANVEKTVIVIAYVSMAGIIFGAVIDRFVFSQQAAWSSTIPIYLFLWVTWMGASYNVKLRSHLAFTEFRSRFPYPLQYACLLLDSLLWIGFGAMIVYYGIDTVQSLKMNFAFVPGTMSMMQWWFYLIIPLGWALLIFRALQNMVQDTAMFRRREPFVFAATLSGD